MGLRTPLYELYVALDAEMVDFDDWGMSLHYGSQIEEHHQVRRGCGVFNMSHMTVADVSGKQAATYLQHLLANDVARLGETGEALHSAIPNEEGEVVDDLIVYLTENGYRVVVNASTRDKDIAWMQVQTTGFKVDLQERGDLVVFAIRGPSACVHNSGPVSPACAALIHEFRPFQSRTEGGWFITRTGYTGEDGLGIMLSAVEAPGFPNELIGAGISPADLGAHDTLHLEAGLNLYGQDMDESVFLLVTNMGWTVVWEPVVWGFVGRRVPEVQKATGDQPKLVGLVLEERDVLHVHQVVRIAGIGEEEITNGSFSPTLNKSITLACVPVTTGDRAEVEIRGG